jgi:hypothetical protein
MHGEVDLAIAQGLFEFGSKEPFASNLGQWPV